MADNSGSDRDPFAPWKMCMVTIALSRQNQGCFQKHLDSEPSNDLEIHSLNSSEILCYHIIIPVWYSKGGSGTQNIPHVPKVVLNKIKGTHPCLIPCKHEASVLQQFNKPTKDYNHLNLWKVLTGLVPWFYFHCMICMLEASSSGGAWLSSGFHCTS